jgi:hypothetical protein
MSYGALSEQKGNYGSGGQFPYTYTTEGYKYPRGGPSSGEEPLGSYYPGSSGTPNKAYGYGETPRDQSNYSDGINRMRYMAGYADGRDEMRYASGYSGAYSTPSLKSPSRLGYSSRRSPYRSRYGGYPSRRSPNKSGYGGYSSELGYGGGYGGYNGNGRHGYGSYNGSNGNGRSRSYSNGRNGNGRNGSNKESEMNPYYYGGYPPWYTSSPGVQQPYKYASGINVPLSQYAPGRGGSSESYLGGSASMGGEENKMTTQHCLGGRGLLGEYGGGMSLSPLRRRIRERMQPLGESILPLMSSEPERLAKLQTIADIGKLASELRKLSVYESSVDPTKATELAVAANDIDSMVKERFIDEAMKSVGNVI